MLEMQGKIGMERFETKGKGAKKSLRKIKSNDIIPMFYIAHTFNQRHYVRDVLVPALQKLGIKTMNPFYREDGSNKANRPEVELADELEKKYHENPERAKKFTRRLKKNYEDIVETDLDMIFTADGIIAYMPDSSTGTTCEIWTCGGVFEWLAKRGIILPIFMDRPVFLITTNERLHMHPWIKYAVADGGIFKTPRSLILHLKKELPNLKVVIRERRRRGKVKIVKKWES